jgi:hypothetical protein
MTVPSGPHRLPLEARRVLWDRLWDRLLRPAPGDTALDRTPRRPSPEGVE